MQTSKIEGGKQTERSSQTKKMVVISTSLVLLFFAVSLFPKASYGAEKKIKKQPAPKEALITDSTVQGSFKKAEEQLKKGDIEGSLRVFSKVYDYTKEALATIGFIQKQYDRLVNEPTTNQNEKEDIFIKLKRMKQLVPKYKTIKEGSAYNMGYIYAKIGDQEKARKYLSEVIETAPFSTKQDSMWMKSKTLLLSLYGLEGEF